MGVDKLGEFVDERHRAINHSGDAFTTVGKEHCEQRHCDGAVRSQNPYVRNGQIRTVNADQPVRRFVIGEQNEC